ncbi:MAG: ATP-binding protein [Bacillota bacterium]|nr:ATP-binding protein [Bacillota bacterium]
MAEDLSVETARAALDSLTVCRGLLQDPVLKKLHRVLGVVSEDCSGHAFISAYADFFHTLLAHNSVRPFADYVVTALLYDDNVYARMAAAADFTDLDACLVKAMAHDLDLLQHVAMLSAGAVKQTALDLWGGTPAAEVIEGLPGWDFAGRGAAAPDLPGFADLLPAFGGGKAWGGLVRELAAFHRRHGAGPFARFRGFMWERRGTTSRLRGVMPDPVCFADLVGYEAERREVVANTLHLLAGLPANNVLLYGDRGTGKSSTVKALVNEYHTRGLRIIEVPKALLADFPAVVREVRDRPQKFIIFIDDLAFEDSEAEYTALKAVLEGGLESRPQNVVVYATSNRRHLVKERFADRAGLRSGQPDDEVRARDTIQEKLSLADRFGITVVFQSPDQDEYLRIVEELAARRGLAIDPQRLRQEALRWEMWHNGRSPRTARQFIDWVEARQRASGLLE